jgi:hypothetical protein
VICGLPQVFFVDLRLATIVYGGGKGAKGEIAIDIVKVNF